jgi:hypothetical protein
VSARLADQLFDVRTGTPDEFGALVRADIAKWTGWCARATSSRSKDLSLEVADAEGAGFAELARAPAALPEHGVFRRPRGAPAVG